MAVRSIWISITLQCDSCSQELPVNSAAESIFHAKCGSHTATPLPFWQYLIAEQLVDAINLDKGDESWAKGMHASIGSYAMTFGRADPACRKCGAAWNIDELLAIAETGAENFTCSGCSSLWPIRRPPEWFHQVVPDPLLIVGETAPGATGASFTGETSVSIHCYHCGGNLDLDGSSRTVKCTYCGNSLLIPDDVWLRLHPVDTAHRWYILVDIGEAVAVVPDDISDVTDIAILPGDEAALLYDSHEGSCIGRADRFGRFAWLIEEITISSDARLFYVAKSDRLWVIAEDEEIVLSFDAKTGDLVREFRNEDDKGGTIAVMANDGMAVMDDETIIVYRWTLGAENPSIRMRRFGSDGAEVPLWAGHDDADYYPEEPDWDSLPDRPIYPPEDALFEPGPNGSLFFIHPERALVARYDGDGKHLGTTQVQHKKEILEITDCGAADDGSVFIVFEHRKKIGGDNWDHVGRIAPDGTFDVIVGPHASGSDVIIGEYGHRIAVAPRGSFLLCGDDFNDLWAMEPDGSVIWQSPGTASHKEWREQELEEAWGKKSFRKKKRE